MLAAHLLLLSLCVGRLVDVLLGPGAAAPHKLEVGNPLVTLGVETGISESGITFKVNPTKAGEWIEQIQAYLQMGMLTSGEASKLAGTLSRPTLAHCCKRHFHAR